MKSSQEVAPESGAKNKKFSLGGVVAPESGAKNKKFSLGGVAVTESVKSGERISNDTEPELETQSQINKFKLNKLASQALDIVPGNRVKILVTNMPSINGKYLIVKTSADDAGAAKVLSPTKADGHGALLFNYAGIYSRMTQATVDAEEKSAASFVEEKVAINRGNTTYLDHKTIYSLVEVEDYSAESPLLDPVNGAQYAKVFALVSPKREEVDLSKVVASRKAKVAVDNGDTTTDATEEMEA